jgi:tRNA pseudouridine38-40 synthase
VTAPPRRLRLDLAYDGTGFAGWQVQPGRPTVQGVLESVLAALQGGAPVHVRGAGRTDAGVNATGQVADFVLRSRLDDARLGHALRSLLPAEVRPLRLRTVAPEFHARRDAVRKTYRYRLDLSPHGDPFVARYALHHPWKLDEARVQEALARLPGRHDWSGFTGSGCGVDDRVRQLAEARLERPSPHVAWLTFTADGFLRHMVRNLVGTLLEIGRGRLRASVIDAALATGDRRHVGPTAAARGLCLARVVYRDGGAGEQPVELEPARSWAPAAAPSRGGPVEARADPH